MAVTGTATGIIKMTAALDAVTGKMKIDYIRWVNGAAADDAFTLTDTAGNVLFESVASGANFIDVHSLPRVCDGIIASVLGSGTVFIYLNAEVRDAGVVKTI